MRWVFSTILLVQHPIRLVNSFPQTLEEITFSLCHSVTVVRNSKPSCLRDFELTRNFAIWEVIVDSWLFSCQNAQTKFRIAKGVIDLVFDR